MKYDIIIYAIIFWYMIAIWANVSTNRREWLTTELNRESFFILRRFFIFMNEQIFMEIFGYVGTGLVLLSFLMQDIKWLRVVNMTGGFISLLYAIYTNTMPVVVLNGSLIMINGVQLMRIIRKERQAKKEVNNREADTYDNKDNEKEENI